MQIGQNIKKFRNELHWTQEMLAHKMGYKSPSTIAKIESGENDVAQTQIIKFAKVLGKTPAQLMGWIPTNEKKEAIRIPVLGRIAAGIPIDAVTDILDYEEITAEMAATGTFFALQVKGESMLPRLYEGDVVIVRQQPDIESGDIAVVLVNGTDATLKQVIKQDGGILLQAYNPSVFPTRFYSNDDIENLPVKILGKAVEARKKL